MIWFHKKHVYLKSNPRRGVCNDCGRDVAKGQLKRTNIHHEKYNDGDFLADTVELCPRCHMKRHQPDRPRNSKGQYIKRPGIDPAVPSVLLQ